MPAFYYNNAFKWNKLMKKMAKELGKLTNEEIKKIADKVKNWESTNMYDTQYIGTVGKFTVRVDCGNEVEIFNGVVKDPLDGIPGDFDELGKATIPKYLDAIHKKLDQKYDDGYNKSISEAKKLANSTS
jgi:hypothetical protein